MQERTCFMGVDDFLPLRSTYARQEKKVVFTNGCFDVLHCGHLHLLEQAQAAGDILVVGLNSDVSVKKSKGDNRPIVPEQERARLLCALKPVDYVILFDEPTPFELISIILPDILVKGADWRLNEIVGADVVRAHGGKVVRAELMQGKSTTDIIETIVKRFSDQRESSKDPGRPDGV